MLNYPLYVFDKSFKLGIYLFLLILLLSNCSAPTSSINSPQETIVVTKATPIVKAMATPLTTAIQLTRTATLTPTALPKPTETPTVLLQPTATNTTIPMPAPWSIKQLGDGVLFHGNKDNISGLYFMQTDGTIQFVAEGEMVGGQPVSPLGNKFIFDSESQGLSRETPGRFALADLTTGIVTTVELLAQPFEIYWAPDESEFIYVAGQLENHLMQLVEGCA